MKSSRQQGNTLILTLVTTGVLGFVLVAYLSLVRSQNIANTRSQCWNQAIPVIEAGIEDALTHLNTHGLTNLNCDNWTQLGSIYYMKRSLYGSYYVVTISNWSPTLPTLPVIESRGYVQAPSIVAGVAGPVLAQIYSYDVGKYLGRGVRAAAKRDWLFAKGMVAKGQIDLKGNNISSDSYDSSDSTGSTSGRYDFWKRRDNGDIATNSGLTNSLAIGNADVWGRVSTGPKGSMDINNGSVGDKNWHASGRKGVQPGYYKNDMNVDFPDVEAPFDGGYLTPGVGTNNGVVYRYLLGSGNYQLSALTLSGSETLYVTGNSVLYVTGDVDITGTASIIVASNATLQVYVSGANASIGGAGVINQTGNATNFAYFGMTNNTSLKFSGNSAFVGVIYAPNADFELGGGGATIYDFSGASVTRTVTMNGHFKFHYDEALGKIGPFRRYILTSWDEMGPNDMKACAIDTGPYSLIN